MFAGLGHDALVGGNNKHNHVNARRPGHHVFDKTLVPRHVHNAKALPAGKLHPGKAQFYGDTPAFFFLQPVAVYTRKRPYK